MQSLKSEASIILGVQTGIANGTVFVLPAQHNPGDSSKFVGHRHAYNIGVRSRLELGDPLTECVVVTCNTIFNGSCPMNEQPAKVFVPMLADSQQLRLASG